MPLSDNEQRLLEQMERALYAEDPKFASAMRGAARRGGARRLLIGVTALVVGLVLLVFGVAHASVPLGVLGFLLMLGGLAYAVSAQRRSGPQGVVGPGGTVRTSSTAARRQRSTFMQRLEQRWDRRRDEQ